MTFSKRVTAEAKALHINYSAELALWEEFFVTWKAGVKPVLLVRDDQIKALAKKGKLTLVDGHIVLNAPIVKVG
jgi:hypothetical protein